MNKQNTSSRQHKDRPQTVIPAKAGISDDHTALSSKRLLELYDRVADAPDAVERLRRFVLDLALRGKLVEQDPKDEPAGKLLDRISEHRARLKAEGKLKRSTTATPPGPDKIPFQLPNSWEWVPLSDIGVIGSSKRVHQSDWVNQGVPFYRAREIVKLARYGTVENDLFITGDLFEELSELGLSPEPGDLMITGVGTIGVCYAVTPGDRFYFKDASVLIFKNIFSLPEAYLRLACSSPYWFKTIHESSMGTTVHTLTISRANTTLIPLPPLAEQHRILAQVEELMAVLDRLETTRTKRESTRNRLTTASITRLTAPDTTKKDFPNHVRFVLDNLHELTAHSEQIKMLRQTILNLAVRGRLVEQDPGDEPATKLLEQISEAKKRLGISHSIAPLSGDEVPFDLPAGWAWTRLGEICSKTGSGSTPRGGKAVYRKFGVPFLRSQNVHNDGFQLDDVAFIDPQIHKKMKGTRVLPGDLLLNITGGSIGRCCQVPDDFEEANVSQHVAIIRPAVIGMADFLHELILSPYFQSFIFDEQTGAGRGGLPKKRMDMIAVALPPLAEQHRIATKIDTLMEQCDKLATAKITVDTTQARLLEVLLHDSLAQNVHKREAA